MWFEDAPTKPQVGEQPPCACKDQDCPQHAKSFDLMVVSWDEADARMEDWLL